MEKTNVLSEIVIKGQTTFDLLAQIEHQNHTIIRLEIALDKARKSAKSSKAAASDKHSGDKRALKVWTTAEIAWMRARYLDMCHSMAERNRQARQSAYSEMIVGLAAKFGKIRNHNAVRLKITALRRADPSIPRLFE